MAQVKTPAVATTTTKPFNTYIYQSLQWRNIGPLQGGRCVAVAGYKNNPLVFLMGAAGGGIWKTEDAGWSWRNISDAYFQSGSVGALAISDADPNVIYAGMGEHTVRGVMTSAGDGVYKSTDGGRSWEHLGLVRSEHIADIRIHPTNPDMVYVAVQGSLYGPSKDRGVYRSSDGGKTWQQILSINNTTGASDLCMDPTNPRILYAGMWDHQRAPWEIRSGGPGSGLYKSTDGGNSWNKLNNGLPEIMGKTAIKVAPANPDRLYAVIEAESGGVYRSDDAGATWKMASQNRATIARAWYFTELVVDPLNQDVIFVLNDPLLKSTDGGQTFTNIPTPHADQHALWINPTNPQQMILGDDGGATITFNGGKTWSSQSNQPTGQFYRLSTDQLFPYTIYTAQQDYTTLAIPSRTQNGYVGLSDCTPVGGGESAFIAFDPKKPQTIYSTGYQGGITTYNSAVKTSKDIMAFPELGLAAPPKSRKYRFNWNAPIAVSPGNGQVLYHGANKVLKSLDGGLNWEEISPDLTRNEVEKQGAGGYPFTNEGAGGENYNTISYLTCVPQQEGTIWVGSDDGLVHLTRNGGKTWDNITPSGLPESYINCIEVSPHNPAQAYMVAMRYRWQDRQPLIYFTSDYGKNWQKITEGIGLGDFVRVVREDPIKPGLLYAGSESGMYVSFNQGHLWQRLPSNLPYCPITDLAIQDNDLIASTSGRGIWVLDDLSALQQNAVLAGNQRIKLITPKPAYRFDAEQIEDIAVGQNPASGVLITYALAEDLHDSPLFLEIFNEQGRVIRTYQNTPEKNYQAYEGGPQPAKILPCKKGLHQFNWDLRRETLPGIPQIFVHGDYRGGLVSPGKYTIRFRSNKDTVSASVIILPDPRIRATTADYQEQATIVAEMENQVRELHLSVNRMRALREQIHNLIAFLGKQDDCKDLVEAGQHTITKIDAWEKDLIQTAQKTPQDVINYRNALNAEMMDLKSRADGADPRVTGGVRLRWISLQKSWVRLKAQMQQIVSQDVAVLNKIFRQKDIPALLLPSATAF
jgi:photosystem II stability/assembly factor-like uncharacterized protein